MAVLRPALPIIYVLLPISFSLLHPSFLHAFQLRFPPSHPRISLAQFASILNDDEHPPTAIVIHRSPSFEQKTLLVGKRSFDRLDASSLGLSKFWTDELHPLDRLSFIQQPHQQQQPQPVLAQTEPAADETADAVQAEIPTQPAASLFVDGNNKNGISKKRRRWALAQPLVEGAEGRLVKSRVNGFGIFGGMRL